MQANEIEALLKDALGLSEVHVESDGSHYKIIAVSDQFAEMSRVKKQQAIYAPLTDKIADGSLHALSIKTFTEKEWQREKMFNVPQ